MHPTDPKSYGAAVSYLRRYAYQSALCIAADDDLDEDGQEAGQHRQPAASKVSDKSAEKPAYSADQFDKNFPLWEGMVKQGKKAPADIIKTVESKATLSAEQKKKIEGLKAEENAQ